MTRKRWSKELVIAALQGREAAGKALNYQAVVVDVVQAPNPRRYCPRMQ